MIADGGRVMSDLALLCDQGELVRVGRLGPDLWRTLKAIVGHALARIAAVRAKTRTGVCGLIAVSTPRS
jgi:hypothetical protein